MSIVDVELYLKQIYPFELLTNQELSEIVNNLVIEYYKKGQKIEDVDNYLYVVLKGVVVEKDNLGNEVGYFGQGSFFDVNRAINRSENIFEAFEESILYKIDKKIILKLVNENERFGEYFKKSTKEKLSSIASENPYFFLKVKEVELQQPVIVSKDTTIYDAVKEMTEKEAYSVIVDFGNGEYGIITDSDIRKKVILQNISTSENVEKIATKGLITINADSFLFDAIFLMIKHNIKRVVVEENGKIIGILNEVDLLSLYSNQPQFLALRVERAKSIKDLKILSDSIARTVKILHKEGIRTRHIMKIVSEINTRIFKKAFLLTAPAELLNHSSLIVMGSEGREEQILKTDQDNGLILEDGYQNPNLEAISQNFIEALKELGYPECKGNVMITNPYWRKSISEFKNSVIDYVNHITPENMLNLAILIDAKYIIGREDLYNELIDFMFSKISDNKTFLSYFALPTIQFKTPLTFFGTFETEKGEHKGELDIKKGGIFPIVHGIRSLAVENKIRETNTFERIKRLSEVGIFNREFASELIEALEFFLTLRLRERLRKMEMGKQPDDYININLLSNFEKDLLKDAFKIVNKFKDLIINHFKLNYISWIAY